MEMQGCVMINAGGAGLQNSQWVFGLTVSMSGLRFDDGAAEGIFGVADPKLCFYSYRCIGFEWACKSALVFAVC